MWQEARKQEKVLRGIMVDYKRRAERRKGYYEKIKKDPAEFLQLWGRQCKIHIDPNIAAAADNPSIMTKWQGDEDTLIDRFDARSHLDFLEEYKSEQKDDDDEWKNLSEKEKNELRMLNYERYRTLVQNEAVGVTESQCLKQIEMDEKYGAANANTNSNEKKIKEPKAQIGYSYADSHKVATSFKPKSPPVSDSSDEENDDLDIALDINKLTSDHKVILNKCATNYGMQFGDYIHMLILENEEKEAFKQHKLLEAEKAQYSGRKSRRERRIAKDRWLKERGDLSPLSFVVKNPEKERDETSSSSSNSSRSNSNSYKRSKSRSKSPKSKNGVLFITSFGASTNAGLNEDEPNGIASKLVPLSAGNVLSTGSSSNKILSLKLLKQNVVNDDISPIRERSKSKSPVMFKKKTKESTNEMKNYQTDSNSSSQESSDEEEALKNYLKRRESRIKNNVDSKSNNNINKTNNKGLDSTSKTFNSKADNKNSNNNNNNNGNSNNNGSNSNINNPNASSKFRSAEEFRLYHEKLKKKMQKQINKQLKKDQKLERERKRKEREERREREAELEFLTEKMRKHRAKERRKKREADGRFTSDSDESSSSSIRRLRSRRRSSSSRSSRSRSPKRRLAKSRSRSKSRSPLSKLRAHRSRSGSPTRKYRKSRSSSNSSRNKSNAKKSSHSSSSSSSSSSSRSRNKNRRTRSSSSSTSTSTSSSSKRRFSNKKRKTSRGRSSSSSSSR